METYVDMLEREIFSHDLRVHYQRNISKEEQEALENLRGYDDIIFKQADNGSAVVVMDRDRSPLPGASIFHTDPLSQPFPVSFIFRNTSHEGFCGCFYNSQS